MSPVAPTTFDVPYSLPSGGATYYVHQGANLQTVIDSAALGDVIVLDAGTTYRPSAAQTFTLPNKTGSGWIYIISSDYASLPQEGNRVSPADAIHMPILAPSQTTPGTNDGYPIVTSMSGSHNYRFVGIDFATAAPAAQEIINLGKNDSGQYATSSDQLSNHIVIDRCYIHQTVNTHTTSAGVELDGRYNAVVNSYIANIWYDGDSNAITVWNGDGPYKIVNNYLEAAGENFHEWG